MKSKKIIVELQNLIKNFEKELKSGDLREKVLALIPCFQQLRKFGKSLISQKSVNSAHDRIIHYLKKYKHKIISGNEIMVVAGIQDYPRRIRELRVQFGWSIISGNTAQAMADEDDLCIADAVKRAVFRRDKRKCQKCGWSHNEWDRSDPRHLELHHIKHHAKGGDNSQENLLTVCTICHDKIHKARKDICDY